jgi:hypothetical protein
MLNKKEQIRKIPERRVSERRKKEEKNYKGKERRVFDRRKIIKGGFLATVGFILSPLSWWNDALINLPLSYIFAIPFGLISKSLFGPMLIFGYWITNVAGFMLMHHGVQDLATKEVKKYTRKEFIKDIIISTAYTGIVVLFILKGWIKFPTEYFN